MSLTGDQHNGISLLLELPSARGDKGRRGFTSYKAGCDVKGAYGVRSTYSGRYL